MKMRERIARALCEADCGRITENELARCRDLVPAVLKAMREPTEMQLAAVKPWPSHWDKDGPDRAVMIAAVQTDRLAAASLWASMIDAALVEIEEEE